MATLDLVTIMTIFIMAKEGTRWGIMCRRTIDAMNRTWTSSKECHKIREDTLQASAMWFIIRCVKYMFATCIHKISMQQRNGINAA